LAATDPLAALALHNSVPATTTAPAGQRRSQRRRSLLAGPPARVLERIAAGDPLGLQPRVERILASRSLLLDSEQVFLRALAICARRARRYRGRPGFERWLEQHVAEAIESLVEEGAGARTSQAPARLDLSGDALASACARFNRLPATTRRAFFRLVVEGRSIDSLVHPGGRSAPEIARQARRALLLFLSPDSEEETR